MNMHRQASSAARARRSAGPGAGHRQLLRCRGHDQLPGAREVHERLRAREGELRRPGRRQDPDQGRDRRNAVRARPAQVLCRGARLRPAEDHDRRQLRRARPHRLDRGRRGEGHRSDRGYAGVARGHQGRRLYHPHQRRVALRPHARRGGRQDEGRPGHAGQAHHRPPRPRQAARRHASIRERIELRPVKWEIKDGVGYININTFTGNVAEQTKAALVGDRQGDRRPSARLCRRPALEPGRPARPGGRRRRRLPRKRRDRLPARPRARTTSSAITRGPATWRTACRWSC